MAQAFNGRGQRGTSQTSITPDRQPGLLALFSPPKHSDTYHKGRCANPEDFRLTHSKPSTANFRTLVELIIHGAA